MTVSRVERLDLTFEPRVWPFAEQRRAEIDAHFAAAQCANPKLWNGRVLLMHRYEIANGVLHGSFFETDYASFHAWLHWDRPPAHAYDCFGSAAVLSSDGAFLLAQMAAHTANAGRIYFPCGTPDPSDIRSDTVDFGHSTSRELQEETGLDVVEFKAEPGWIIIEEQARVVAYKIFHAQDTGQKLRQRVEAHMAKEPGSELAAIHLVRDAAGLVPAMPNYVTTFLRHVWSSQ
jgi:8-oxo-dGTP pyrophosphatase MutT (NUDIX family)